MDAVVCGSEPLAVAMVIYCGCYNGVVTHSDICWCFPSVLLGLSVFQTAGFKVGHEINLVDPTSIQNKRKRKF